MDAVPDHESLAEYRAARDAVGVVDRSDLGVVEVTGRDRAKFLHALLSNDIAALAPGQGCAATLLDIHGKVQVTLVVLVLDDRMLLLTPPGMGESTVAALDHYLFAEKVTLEDVTGQRALLMLVGPAAEETAKRLTGAAPPDAPWSHVAASLDGPPEDIDARVVRGGARARVEGRAGGGRAAARRRGARVAAHRGRHAVLRRGRRCHRAAARDPVGAPDLAHQGLLSRPGGRRPHPRPRSRQPPSPWPAARGRGGAAARRRGRRRRRRRRPGDERDPVARTATPDRAGVHQASTGARRARARARGGRHAAGNGERPAVRALSPP